MRYSASLVVSSQNFASKKKCSWTTWPVLMLLLCALTEPAAGNDLQFKNSALSEAHRGAQTTRTSTIGAGTMAVVYPDIGEPFRTVFAQIVSGIEKQARNKVIGIPISSATTSKDIDLEIKRQEIVAIIALGRNGLRIANNLESNIPIVVGAIINASESEVRSNAVVSLAPDPNLLFAKLKSIAPSIRRVHVVYDPDQNGWLIRLARDAAKVQGLELIRYESSDLKTAVKAYQDIFIAAESRRDAVWLPQDNVSSEESTVLPFVLQESWNRSIVLFSSSLPHVRRGALFSLYPNNVDLGRRLGVLAFGSVSGSGTRGIQALQDVFTAVNTRTANHLGLSIKEQEADFAFPPP